MEFYDPLKEPNAEEWLAEDEQERVDLIVEYHRRIGEELPDEMMHAIIHNIVETQIASGESRVNAAANRLLNQGLDRHDSIHAIASVLAARIYDIMHQDNRDEGTEDYYLQLDNLTAKKWLDGQ